MIMTKKGISHAVHLRSVFVFLLLVGGIMTVSGQTNTAPRNPEPDDQESGEEIIAREKFIYTRRAGGPGRVIPDDAYAQAVAQYDRLTKGQRNRGVDAALPSWTSVNPSGLFYNLTGSNYISGRTNSIAFDPADPTIIYIAAAGGGVWRSTDNGVNWSVLTDNLSSLACGAIATDPTTSDVVYLGTGELNYSGDSYYGNGLFKTTDGGATWVRLFDTFIGRYYSQIVVDPFNPSVVYVASDKNIYKSTDGGVSWSNTSCGTYVNSLVMDPGNTQVLYSAIGGTSTNSIRKSTNGGASWSTLTAGLPTTSMGRTQLAIAPTNGNVLYASISNRSTNQLLGLYRTTDGGGSWTLQAGYSASWNYLGVQGWYDNAVTVSPIDPDFVVVGGLDIFTSIDGGVTLDRMTSWFTSNPTNFSHADIHFLGYNINTGDLYCGSDGGVYRSSDDGNSWVDLNANLSTLQYQSADYDPTNTLKMYGGTQDNNIERTADGGASWIQYTTGDGGYTIVDPVNTNVIYSQYVLGSLKRSEDEGIGFVEISPVGATGGLFYNPYEMAPGNNEVIVYAQSNIWKTTSASTATSASDWTMISGSVGANVSAIGISATDINKIYIGTDNGRILTTTNNGAVWATPISGLPYVSDLVVDPANDAVCYATFGGFSPSTHVLKTTNSGATWNNITPNMPNIPVNTIVLRSTLPRMIFIGTDLGVYRSTDDGGSWAPFNNGLPTLAVFDLKYKEGAKLLLAATHGRGCFTYDLSGFSFGASPVSLAFGNILVGTSRQDSVTVTNTGTTTINISTVTSGNAKFVVSPTSGTIAASASKTFYVTYHPVSMGPDTSAITFTHDGITSPDIVTVWGVGGAPTFSATPVNLNLGTVLVGLTRTDSVIVSNTGNTTLHISSATSSNGLVTVSPATGTIPPSGNQKFYVHYQPTSPVATGADIIFDHDGLTTPDTITVAGAGGISTVQIVKLVDSDGNPATTADQLPKTWHFVLYHDSVSASSILSSADSSIVTLFVPSAGTYIVSEADSGPSWRRINGNKSRFDTLSILAGTLMADTVINRHFSTTISVVDRWNMISMPMIQPDSNALALFPDAISEAYKYLTSYQSSLNLWKGVGYWLKFTAPHSYTFAGQPVENLAIDVRAGWNLIGSLAEPILKTSIVQVPSGIVTSSYFRYRQGYFYADTLFPGDAYWVKTTQSGQLLLSSGNLSQPSALVKTPESLIRNFHELTVTDRDGFRQLLYVGARQLVASMENLVDLPPRAPQAVTDIRFSSNRMVESYDERIDGRISLSVSAASYPIKFEWKSAERFAGLFSLSWREEAGRIEMPFSDHRIIMVQDSSATAFFLNYATAAPTPKAFSLEQNYPNPLNPLTVIRYSLPVDARVTLRVYNVLGEEVARLVEEFQASGFKSVEWHAEGIPSGVYYYKLSAGEFTDVKKMLVIK